ncbi:MAG: SEC-C domain-containing protein [Lewinellaceae bacterium]|nr:SEC-C domain-containing protein [Lewinellaceae bacterium]
MEENNFGIRKRLLEYDDVMNIQREAIYKKRRNALFGDRLAVDINDAFAAITNELVQTHRKNGDFETFRFDSIRLIGVDPEMDPDWFNSAPIDTVAAVFQQQVYHLYEEKSRQVSARLLPVIQDVNEREGHRYKRIVVPFTDGVLGTNVSADMEEALKSNGKSIMHDIEKVAILTLIDDDWKEHLRNIDDLKESVQGTTFEQKDPLVIYKMEAYTLFEGLVGHINSNVTSFLLKGSLSLPPEDEESVAQAAQAREEALRRAQANRLRLQALEEFNESEDIPQESEYLDDDNTAEKRTPKKPRKKTIRQNDPCPCGSGKKYKLCHGRE